MEPEPAKEVEAPKKAAAPEVDLSGVEAKETPATEYLKSILVGMGFADVKVTAKETEDDIYFEIVSEEDYGNIGGVFSVGTVPPDFIRTDSGADSGKRTSDPVFESGRIRGI